MPYDNLVLNATGDKNGFLTGAGQTGLTSIDLPVAQYRTLAVDLNLSVLSGGTGPTVNYTINRKGWDGVYYGVTTPTALSAVGKTSQSIGLGSVTNADFGAWIQVVITITGAPTTATWTMSIVGK